MGTTQYIGARYVPKFADPINWQSNVAYEPLTIVTENGNSYTSKKAVPAGLPSPSNNSAYWAATGMYNQQVEEYRQEVVGVQNQLSTVDAKAQTGINNAATADAKAVAAQTAANNAQDDVDTITDFTWERIEGKRIGIFGASQERNLDWCWPGQFISLVGSHATVNVYGISGAEWGQIINSVETNINNCDIFLINTSANDATSGVVPGGVGDSAQSPYYWGGYKHLHDLIAVNPNKEFYVIGTNSKALTRKQNFTFPLALYQNLDVQGSRYAGANYIDGEYLYGNLNDETNRVPLSYNGDGIHLTTPYTTYKAERVLRILLAGIPYVGSSGYYEATYNNQALGLFVPNTEAITVAGFTVTATPDKIILMGKITFNSAISSPVSIFSANEGFDKIFYPQSQRMIPLTLILNHSPYTHVDCHYNFLSRSIAVTGAAAANDYGFYGEIPLRVINYMPQ